MNNSVQHKMLDAEVTPPEGVWQRIAEELDESALAHNFPSRLKQHEVTPPATAWQKIAATLSAGDIPASVAEKLGNASAKPPARAWNRIRTLLDAGQEAASPAQRKIPLYLKYAAAAVVAGLMIVGGIKLFNNNKTGDKAIASAEAAAHQQPDAPVNTTITSKASVVQQDNTEEALTLAQEKRNDAALEASKKTFASLDMNSSRLRKIASGYHFASVVTGPNDPAPPADNLASRYITVTMPDCNVVRMSKKLEHLTCCVSGELVDKNCMNQVEKWRQQLACSTVGHPANFMDILELVDALGDE